MKKSFILLLVLMMSISTASAKIRVDGVDNYIYNGNVNITNSSIGIGTTSPTSQLHVIGRGNITSDLWVNNAQVVTISNVTWLRLNQNYGLNATGALTDNKWCKWDATNSEIDCNVDPVVDTYNSTTDIRNAQLYGLNASTTDSTVTFIRANQAYGVNATSAPGGNMTGTWASMKLAVDSVSSGNIVDGSIVAADIASGAVTGVKVAADTINGTELADTIVLDANLAVTSANVSFDSGTLFVDQDNDRVGIGTTNPGQKLDVNGTGLFQDWLHLSNAKGIQADGDLYIKESGGNSILTQGTHTYWGTRASGNLYFSVNDAYNGTRVMTIENAAAVANTLYLKAGNVGIGTTTPTSTMHVIGNGNITTSLVVNNAPVITTANTSWIGSNQNYGVNVSNIDWIWTTANNGTLATQAYVNAANTSMKAYADAANTSAVSYMTTYTNTANTSMKAYVDGKTYGNSSIDIWNVVNNGTMIAVWNTSWIWTTANNGTLASIAYVNAANASQTAYNVLTYLGINTVLGNTTQQMFNAANNGTFARIGGTNQVIISGENITSGTVADARIASTITRDSEVPSLETDAAHDSCSEISGCVVGAITTYTDTWNSTTDIQNAQLKSFVNTTSAPGGNLTGTWASMKLGTNSVSGGNIVANSIDVSLFAVDLGLGWVNLTNYPTACSGSQVMQGVGDTLTCVTNGNSTANIQAAQLKWNNTNIYANSFTVNNLYNISSTGRIQHRADDKECWGAAGSGVCLYYNSTLGAFVGEKG